MSQAIQDHDTGEQSPKEQALSRFREPHKNSAQYLDDKRNHTDADDIRRSFGIPAWENQRHKFEHHGHVLPDCLEHHRDAGLNKTAGGTDFLCRGSPGSGKSTFARYVALRLIEINDEKVVWRGSTSRSEWLALAPWTRLCLPQGVEIDAYLESMDPTEPDIELEEHEIERIVREVVYYDDPVHLNRELLKPGMIHVVYPDPQLRGCQEVYERSAERTYEAPSGRELFDASDPANHWWFAWVLARVEHGPHHWTSVIFDEIGDIAPQSARKDQFGTYQKVELLRDSWVDARKKNLSLFLFGHSEVDIHQFIRHKIRWRVQMPGDANPTSASKTVGFESIRMETDITSDMGIGEALIYEPSNFQPLGFKEIYQTGDYDLKIEVGGGV